MLMQTFGRTNKEYYGIFESGLLDNFRFKLDVITTNIDFPASDKIDSKLGYFFCVTLTRFLGNYTHIQEQWVLQN